MVSVGSGSCDSPIGSLPESWSRSLELDPQDESLAQLEGFLADERARDDVYPQAADVFAALRLTPRRAVRVVIVGQDPYHQPGQADGLAFSVRPGVRLPPSLRTIIRELENDLARPVVTNGSLVPWALQGVLLLNAVLTVRRGAPRSHAGHGWEQISSAIIRAVVNRATPSVFVLWGTRSLALRPLIDEPRHGVITSSHPSPRSAWRGFVGSSPFRRANEELAKRGQPPIDWELAM